METCPQPSHLAFQKEFLVSPLQDIELRVVEFGVLIAKPISFSHISAPSEEERRTQSGHLLQSKEQETTQIVSRHSLHLPPADTICSNSFEPACSPFCPMVPPLSSFHLSRILPSCAIKQTRPSMIPVATRTLCCFVSLHSAQAMCKL